MVDELRQFQLSFGKYLRDPENIAIPDGIDSSRVTIYQNLIFNNVKGFIDSCFPVCKTLLSESEWLSLIRNFFVSWRASSPYFHEVPQEFLSFLQQNPRDNLPPWFLELAHYEWVELAVDTADDTDPSLGNISPETDGDEVIRCNTTLQNVSYAWPVHKISAESIPENPENTFLVVYRDNDFNVQFSEINPATSVMLNFIQNEALTRSAIVDRMHEVMPDFSREQLQGFIYQIIDQLLGQQILMTGRDINIHD